MMTGCVYLVGAGLGNPAFLTLKAKSILAIAEVLLYDSLVDDQLLSLVPSHCLKIAVGKRGGQVSTPQAQINQQLVHYCQQGKQVVRLKGGDPFIFGRSNPEIRTLVAANCIFQVIPGISSALAAPLLAGIPLTDKDLSQTFAVCSAHDPTALDWAALAALDTLVLLMGTRQLSVIVSELKAHGRSSTEPVAIIRHAGRAAQQIWRGTLADIVDQTANVSLSPAVIVVGNVVNLSTMMQSSSLPLNGKTILVTRAAEASSYFTNLLEQKGATVIEVPALVIGSPTSWQALDQAIADLSHWDWIILASANGVNAFFERLRLNGQDLRALAGIKFAVVGKKTALVLQEKGIQPDFIPPNFVADSLVEYFPEALAGQKLLFPRVESGGRETLIKQMQAQGAMVEAVAAYQSTCPERINELAWHALVEKRVDIITFASSKTVKNFHTLLQQAIATEPNLTVESLLTDTCLASIGPQTSNVCQKLLGRVDVEASEYTLDGLTEALIKYF